MGRSKLQLEIQCSMRLLTGEFIAMRHCITNASYRMLVTECKWPHGWTSVTLTLTLTLTTTFHTCCGRCCGMYFITLDLNVSILNIERKGSCAHAIS